MKRALNLLPWIFKAGPPKAAHAMIGTLVHMERRSAKVGLLGLNRCSKESGCSTILRKGLQMVVDARTRVGARRL